MAPTPKMSSARMIWLAGQAAIKDTLALPHGKEALDALVRKGQEVEAAARKKAERHRRVVEVPVRGRQPATTAMGQVGVAFDERIARALDRLGIPTAVAVNRLTARIAHLEKIIADLTRERARTEPIKKSSDRQS